MVRIQVKHGDTDAQQFLYDCTSSSQIREIAQAVVQISNTQSNINRLALRVQPHLLPLYGDPKAVPLTRALSEAKSYASKDQVSYNRPLSIYVLRDHIQTIERELMVNYQLLGFSDSTQLQQLLTDTEPLPEDSTQLFWAGKELMRDKKSCDYIGKNEKTKIIIRLQSPGCISHVFIWIPITKSGHEDGSAIDRGSSLSKKSLIYRGPPNFVVCLLETLERRTGGFVQSPS